jgi:hypothetical protein
MALPAALLLPVVPLLSIGLLLEQYDTAKPLETFRVESALQIAMGIVGGCLMLVAAAALISSFYPRAVEELKRANRRVMGVDAVVAAAAAAGLALLWRQFHAASTAHFHAQAMLSVSTPDLLATAAPAAAAIASAVESVLLRGALLGLIVLLAYQIRHRWMLVAGALGGLCVLLPMGMRTPAEFALAYGLAASVGAAAVAFCWFFARRNYLAYALVLWLMALRGPLGELLGNGNPSLDIQARILVVVMALSVGWVLAPALNRAPDSA